MHVSALSKGKSNLSVVNEVVSISTAFNSMGEGGVVFGTQRYYCSELHLPDPCCIRPSGEEAMRLVADRRLCFAHQNVLSNLYEGWEAAFTRNGQFMFPPSLLGASPFL